VINHVLRSSHVMNLNVPLAKATDRIGMLMQALLRLIPVNSAS
jgi:hypothetical protein